MAKSFLLLALALVVAARSRVLSAPVAPPTTATMRKATTPDLNVTSVSIAEKQRETQLSQDLLLTQEERGYNPFVPIFEGIASKIEEQASKGGPLAAKMADIALKMRERLGTAVKVGGVVLKDLPLLRYHEVLEEQAAAHLTRVAFVIDDVKPHLYRDFLLTSAGEGTYKGGRDVAKLEAEAYEDLYNKVRGMESKRSVVSDGGRKRFEIDADVYRVAAV